MRTEQEQKQQNDAQGEPASTQEPVSRRAFVGAAAIAGLGMAGARAVAQTRAESKKGRTGNSASDPGEENKPLLAENPNSNEPPFTDHGDPGTIWYSFDLAKKRLQGGGWTHQVTDRELPNSKEIAGVNMRLTAGSFRELHWHTSDEWAYMITGDARVTLLQTDGKMFIDDVKAGDLWYFPAGLPHSIQGTGNDGCEFLLVFNDGHFSEDDTFLLSDWLAHTPPEVIQKNMGWTEAEFNKLPPSELYIFEAPLPKSLDEDKRFIGANLETEKQYTFKLSEMPPSKTSAGGEVRIVDSSNFLVSEKIASALVRLKPGGIRELHWHPTGTEWQFLHPGEGSYDGLQHRGPCTHHGLQRERCRLHPKHGRPLHREHGDRGSRVSGDVQGTPLPGCFAQQLDRACAAGDGRGSPEADRGGDCARAVREERNPAEVALLTLRPARRPSLSLRAQTGRA